MRSVTSLDNGYDD